MTTGSRPLLTGITLGALLLGACSLIRDLDELEPGPDASTGSSDSAIDVKADSVGAACPAEMVEQRFEDGVRFCIDRTEVTQGAYATFLLQDAGAALPTTDCQGNASLRPDEPIGDGGCASTFEPVARAALPVVCVDHCDALTYCKWRGARLCDGKAGARLDQNAVNQVTVDEWFVACSGAKRRFASGESPAGCVFSRAAPEPVTSPGCATPENVLHLSGNVSEWTGTCGDGGGGGGTGVRCLARGGSFADGVQELGCAFDGIGLRVPSARAATIGFRCCRNL
jgi:formylglycine-generating enzyme